MTSPQDKPIAVRGMFVNNLLTLEQLLQTKKLREDVIEVTNAIERQTALQNQSHNASIEVMERQLQLLESEQIRKQVERTTKQAIFSIRQTIKKIDNAKSNLGKYLLSKETFEFLSNSGFTVESLEDIQDKEIFHECIENLKKQTTQTFAILSEEELKVISDCNENTERINLLDAVEIEYTNLKAEYKPLDKANDKVDVTSENTKSSATFVSSVGALLFVWGLGYGAYCLISSSAAKDGIYYAIGGLVVGLILGTSGANAKKTMPTGDNKALDLKRVELDKKLNALEMSVRNIVGDGYGADFLDAVKSAKLKLTENSRNLLSPHLINE